MRTENAESSKLLKHVLITCFCSLTEGTQCKDNVLTANAANIPICSEDAEMVAHNKAVYKVRNFVYLL